MSRCERARLLAALFVLIAGFFALGSVVRITKQLDSVRTEEQKGGLARFEDRVDRRASEIEEAHTPSGFPKSPGDVRPTQKC